MTSHPRPKPYPFTTGKRKNWHGESRISLPIRAQRFLGKKFTIEFAVDMAVELAFAHLECTLSNSLLLHPPKNMNQLVAVRIILNPAAAD
jgi:hypothetical protein